MFGGQATRQPHCKKGTAPKKGKTLGAVVAGVAHWENGRGVRLAKRKDAAENSSRLTGGMVL